MGGSAKALAGGTYALKAGILHIDTAQIYSTEKEAGEAIKQAGLKREDVYVTTKRESALMTAMGSAVDLLQSSTCPVSPP